MQENEGEGDAGGEVYAYARNLPLSGLALTARRATGLRTPENLFACARGCEPARDARARLRVRALQPFMFLFQTTFTHDSPCLPGSAGRFTCRPPRHTKSSIDASSATRSCSEYNASSITSLIGQWSRKERIRHRRAMEANGQFRSSQERRSGVRSSARLIGHSYYQANQAQRAGVCIRP